MTERETLLQYKEILRNLKKYKLSDEELARMAKGEIPYPEGFPTGYPSLDKRWLAHFDPKFLAQELPHQTIYDYMHEKSLPYQDLTAITYFGKKIKYRDLYEHIDDSAKALTSLGVQKNDRILYLMPNIPETAYLMYGGSRIGAISDFADPRPNSIDRNVSAQKMLDLIKREKCKYIVALDQCYLAMLKPIEHELKDLGIEQIMIVSAKDSMDFKSTAEYIEQGIRTYGLKEFTHKLRSISEIEAKCQQAYKDSAVDIVFHKDLSKNSRTVSIIEASYDPSQIAIITHTSGTTSIPKPVPATHDQMNAFTHQSFGARMPFEPGDRVLHILPYFASFGVTDILHTGLVHATNLIEIPEVETSKFGKIVYLNKGEIVVGLPCWDVAMMNDSYLRGKDLSFLKYVSYGGTSMDVQDEIDFNEFMKSHGSKAVLAKGHGMSELEGCASNGTEDFNPIGSMGIPMPKTIYAILDPETHEPLRLQNEHDILYGEIAISSAAVTSTELDGVSYGKHIELFGEDYLLSGDLGSMKYDGTLIFDQRKDRGFPRYDGYNIKPSKIESAIKTYKGVRYCVVTPYYDESKMGNMIKANVVLDESLNLTDEEKEMLVKRIIEDCFVKNPSLTSREIPSKFSFKLEIPLTPNGKEDFNALIHEDLTGDEITVLFDESNISINGIKVQGPEKPRKFIKKR